MQLPRIMEEPRPACGYISNYPVTHHVAYLFKRITSTVEPAHKAG